MKPRHLPRNTAAQDLRKELKIKREFNKCFGENWWRIRETQRFNGETYENQWD